MAKLDFHSNSATISPINISAETLELAEELQREKPDQQLVRYLITDRGADVRSALEQARLEESDLSRKAQLRPLCLQRYLHPK